MIPIVLAVFLVLGGLGTCWLSRTAVSGIMATVAFWAGAIVAVLGLLMLLVPVLIWAHRQLTEMFGV